jgi:hypothetical protein
MCSGGSPAAVERCLTFLLGMSRLIFMTCEHHTKTLRMILGTRPTGELKPNLAREPARSRALLTPAMVSKNVTLHRATNRDVAFHVGNDLFAGPVPVNKEGGNR